MDSGTPRRGVMKKIPKHEKVKMLKMIRIEKLRTFSGLASALLLVAVIASSAQLLPLAHATGSFTMSASPSLFFFLTGDPNDYSNLTVTSVGGFSGTVALTYIPPSPSGYTLVSGPASIIVPAGGSNTTTLTVYPGRVSGTFTWTVQGSGGGFTTHTTITIKEKICTTPPCPL
jgi:hypothetical protein